MVFKTIGNPIRKGGGATNEVGLIPTDHAAKGRIHISNTPIHIKHTHARRHGGVHRASKTSFSDYSSLGTCSKASVIPKSQEAEDNQKRKCNNHPKKALLTCFLIDGDKHHAIAL